MACFFRGCPYPPIGMIRDINEDVPTCRQHAEFLNEEAGHFDIPMRRVYLAALREHSEPFWEGEGLSATPRSPRGFPRTFRDYLKPSSIKAKWEIREEQAGKVWLKDATIVVPLGKSTRPKIEKYQAQAIVNTAKAERLAAIERGRQQQKDAQERADQRRLAERQYWSSLLGHGTLYGSSKGIILCVP